MRPTIHFSVVGSPVLVKIKVRFSAAERITVQSVTRAVIMPAILKNHQDATEVTVNNSLR